MKIEKLVVIGAMLFSSPIAMMAGGLLTNTNQSAHFIRNPARDASTEIDAAYTNPAGLAKLEQDGFHFAFSNQSAFQTREITSTFAPFKLGVNNNGSATKYFEGTASAPIIPSLQGAYKKGQWVLSGYIGVIGGGGKATFSDGLPSFEAGMAAIAAGTGSSQYSINQYMSGSSFIFGGQLGGTYAINEVFSVYGGFRLNVVSNSYEGYLKDVKINPTGTMISANTYLTGASAQVKAAGDGLQPLIDGGRGELTMQQLLGASVINQATFDALQKAVGNPVGFENMSVNNVQSGCYGASQKYQGLADNTADRELDVTQSGWGITPIIGVNISLDKLNIGVKYEHKAGLNLENKTLDGKDAGMPAYKHGVNTAHDIPGLLTIGASYKVLPQMTASVGYHHFFDSSAKMANDKQKYTGNGTNEYIVGLEYQIDKMFLVSAGTQFTNYGVEDNYQSDLSFSVSSVAVGFGGAVNVSERVRLNIGYFHSFYEDYTKKVANYNATGAEGQDVFTRTNKVFAAGVDFRF